jgi:hypothetical protein
MRIDEFAQPTNDNLPYDVVDDVSVYMRNDPMFYRKKLFPAIMRMKDMHSKGKTVDATEALGAICDEAMGRYCDKFSLGRTENIFKDEDRGLLINKVFGEEMKMIKDGQY